MSEQTDTSAATGPTLADAMLGPTDIDNVLKIIDHAADEGAFKGWHVIQQVLSVRTRLTAFLAAAQVAQAQAQTNPNTEAQD